MESAGSGQEGARRPVLDDVRDLEPPSRHHEKIQATDVVEFASTPGGGCAYKKDLYRLPIVVTVNNTTRNLDRLRDHDFLLKFG